MYTQTITTTRALRVHGWIHGAPGKALCVRYGTIRSPRPGGQLGISLGWGGRWGALTPDGRDIHSYFLESDEIGVIRHLVRTTDTITSLPPAIAFEDMARGLIRAIALPEMNFAIPAVICDPSTRPLAPAGDLLVSELSDDVSTLANTAMGVISGIIPALQGILLPQLVQEGRLTIAELGQVATAEAAATLLAISVANAWFKFERLRYLVLAAALIGLTVDLATSHLTGHVILVLRFIHGLRAGIVMWVWVGFLIRSDNPGRWVAIYVTVQATTLLALSSWFSATLLPISGAVWPYRHTRRARPRALPCSARRWRFRDANGKGLDRLVRRVHAARRNPGHVGLS